MLASLERKIIESRNRNPKGKKKKGGECTKMKSENQGQYFSVQFSDGHLLIRRPSDAP